ncbi:dipeptide ABC transporter ATP-binding protein [Falsirhodobacter sp. 1013]|uniref:dipeptide ABC transporter ATP-binding protein n=1 Tax=Falsirhodobacter sp. 1013 TaxID=3417566 RepID=UPI003EBD2599
MPLLQAENLTVSVRNNRGDFRIISDLSFSLEQGRTLGLVGESGAGKSMIGRTVAQLLPAGFGVTGGRLTFAGDDLVNMRPDARRGLFGRDIAFIPQEPLSALNPVLTIGQQMREHLAHISTIRMADWRDHAIRAFEDVHLPEVRGMLDKYPHQLSGGQCQRVLIAMAFASRPRLLIADEPTTALDVTVQARIVDLIAQMQKRDGTSVIFITHDLRLAAQICDEVLVLYAGRQAEQGSGAAIFTRPAHPYTRCLQLAIPSMQRERGLFTLPDRMPGLAEIRDLKGCRFATRCPSATAICQTEEPQPQEVAPGHVTACFHPETAVRITPPPAPDHAGQEGEVVLTAASLGKTYVTKRRLIGRDDTFTAVKGADFDLRTGEFVGIVGESGSGKSTVAKLLIGMEKPSNGTLTLLGRDVTANTDPAFRRRAMQIVFQDPASALNPRRRVGSIVTQALEAEGKGDPARAVELLREIGLSPEMAQRYPSQMSGGQKQRVNIARALCTVPKILIADEIVSGLDVSVQAQLLELLLRLRQERGFSMMFISHDLSVVRYLCDRVIVMLKGEIVESGPVEEVFANPRHSYTRTLIASMPPERAEAIAAE